MSAMVMVMVMVTVIHKVKGCQSSGLGVLGNMALPKAKASHPSQAVRLHSVCPNRIQTQRMGSILVTVIFPDSWITRNRTLSPSRT